MAGKQVSDELLQQLYQGDPARFVTDRDERARAARAAGEEGLARAIGALRKPTTAAWAVNRVAAEKPRRVAELVEVGDALRSAQRDLRGDEIRRLDRRRAEVVADLTARAAQAVERGGKPLGEQARRQVESTFAAAVAEPESARRVRAGVLSGALEYSGFGMDELSVAAMRSATARREQGAAPRRRGTRGGAQRGGERSEGTRPRGGRATGSGKRGPEHRTRASAEDAPQSAAADRPGSGHPTTGPTQVRAGAEHGRRPTARRRETPAQDRRAGAADRATTKRDRAGTTAARAPGRTKAAPAATGEEAASAAGSRAKPATAKPGKAASTKNAAATRGTRRTRDDRRRTESGADLDRRRAEADRRNAAPDHPRTDSDRSRTDSDRSRTDSDQHRAEEVLRSAEQERDRLEQRRDELRAELAELTDRLRDTKRQVTRARRRRDATRRRDTAHRDR